ncbi:MAG: TIGR02757 family protein [Phycisphaera sp.]|nr:TIGR02757 family protein [Phycisphaera sp.]
MTTLTASQSNALSHAAWLERVYRRFHRPQHVSHDPLTVLYRYDDAADREVAALVASALAYGRVASILHGVNRVLEVMGDSPAGYLRDRAARQLRSDFAGFRYRFTSDVELCALLLGARAVIAERGSLEAEVAAHLRDGDATVLPAVGGLVDAIVEAGGDPLFHLLPHPKRGSACKRLMLMLRWLVRRDRIDPGGWNAVSPALLVVPLDTHLHRVSRSLGLTERKQANLAAAMEVTEALRTVRPDDPLRYDFSLTRPGILGVPIE